MDDLSPGDAIRIQGHVLRFLSALLQRKGLMSTREFSELLGLYAEVVSEAEPADGEILATWAEEISHKGGH